MAPQNNILLQKLATPKKVRLPKGRKFLARYERVNRGTLAPTNVNIRRTYTRSIGLRRQRQRRIGPRRQRRHRQPQAQQQQQQGTGIENNLIKGINLGKKAANTEAGRMIVNETVG